MKVRGIIAMTLLLTASTARAEGANGKELVERFFADCDAVFEEPSHLLQIGDLLAGAPAAATVDGKILTVTVPTDLDQPALPGAWIFNTTILPGGASADCTLSLFGGPFSEELGIEIREESIARSQALVGEDAIQIGGMVGGPAMFNAQANGNAHIDTWATPDFPPTATVTIATSPQFANVTVKRYKAAP